MQRPFWHGTILSNFIFIFWHRSNVFFDFTIVITVFDGKMQSLDSIDLLHKNQHIGSTTLTTSNFFGISIYVNAKLRPDWLIVASLSGQWVSIIFIWFDFNFLFRRCFSEKKIEKIILSTGLIVRWIVIYEIPSTSSTFSLSAASIGSCPLTWWFCDPSGWSVSI